MSTKNFRVASGVPSAGQFAAFSHPEVAVSLAPADPASTDQPPRQLEAAQHVLTEYAELEIMNHSAVDRQCVQLDELGDPDLARGNCWAATSELIENVGAAEFDAEWLDEITLTGHGQHVAILVAHRDGLHVIDYTARQFSPELPFPLIADVESWKRIVEESSGQAWNFGSDNQTEPSPHTYRA